MTSLMDLPPAKQLKFKCTLVQLLNHHLHTILPNLEALSLLRMQGRKYINQVFLKFELDIFKTIDFLILIFAIDLSELSGGHLIGLKLYFHIEYKNELKRIQFNFHLITI